MVSLPSFVYDFSVLSPMFFVNKNSENIFEKFLKKRLTFVLKLAIIILAVADVAELADAHGSGPCESNFMGVQVPSSAPKARRKTSFSFYPVVSSSKSKALFPKKQGFSCFL